MLPTLADAADLAQWANRLDAQGLLPKLIHRLILATSKAELSTTERGSTPSTFYPGGPLFGTSVDVCSKTLLCVMSLAARSRMMARRSCSSFCMLH